MNLITMTILIVFNTVDTNNCDITHTVIGRIIYN